MKKKRANAVPEEDSNKPEPSAIAVTEQLAPLLEQLRASLADPTVQALRQRDAFQKAWDDAIHQLLRNMQQIREDIRAINASVRLIAEGLNNAANAGKEDTERILALISESSRVTIREITQTIWMATPTRPEPHKRINFRVKPKRTKSR